MADNSNNKYFNTEEFKKGLYLYEESIDEGKGCILSSDEISDIAEYYYEDGRYSDAKKAAEYANLLYPDASSPLLFLARMFLTIGRDNKKATAFLKQIANVEVPDYYILSGEIKLFEEDEQTAFSLFNDGYDILDEDEHAEYILEVAHTLIDYNQPEEAAKWAERYGETESAEYLKLRARLLFESNDRENSIDLLETLLDKDPFNTELWNMLSTFQIASDNFSDAVTSSEYAIAINYNNAEAYMNSGNAYFQIGNYEKAINAYKRFSAINRNEIGDILIARCLFCLQKTDEAIGLLNDTKKRCNENKANLIEIYKDLALIYSWTGDYKEAYKNIKRLRENGFDDAELYLIEGGIALSKNKFDEANIAFMEGYEKSHDCDDFLFQVAISYYEHGYDSAAYLMLEDIFMRNPKRTHGLAYLAVCSYYLGKENEYLKYLKTATEHNPEEAKSVLKDIFPSELEPCDYYNYALLHANNSSKVS